MGTNISVYLDDDDIEWLDQLCGEWGLSRGKAISFVLKQSRQFSGMLGDFLKTQNPELSKALKEMMKGSKK